MDMLKKARGKAMAAVKEVQKEVQGITQIIQTPSQQAAGYHNPSYQHAPYQQYGQQHPPQLQNFQTQYTAPPSQTYPPGQSQQPQYGAQNQYTNTSQYPQYGHTQAHQPQAVPQPYGQTQPQYGTQTHQPQHTQQYNQQGQPASTPPTQQYSSPQVPPPYSPPVNGPQVHSNQGSMYGSQTQTPVSSPPAQQPFPGGQPYQHPQQFQQHVQQNYQYGVASPSVSSPIQGPGQPQFPGSSQSPQSQYSTQGGFQQNQQISPLHQNQQHPSYFPPVASQAQPNYPLQPQAQQVVSHPPSVQHVSSLPAVPYGKPQTASPPPNVSQPLPHQNMHGQQAQSPPIHDRQSVSSPPPPQYPHQVSHPPSAASPILAPPSAPPPVQGQTLASTYETPSVTAAQAQPLNRPTQSPVQTPKLNSAGLPPVPAVSVGRIHSPPPGQEPQIQAPPQQSQGSIQAHTSQPQRTASPVQEQKIQPFVAAPPPDPSLTPAPLNLRPRTNSSISQQSKPASPPPTQQYQAFEVLQSHSQNTKPFVGGLTGNETAPSRNNASSPSPPPVSPYQAFGATPSQAAGPLVTQTQVNQHPFDRQGTHSPSTASATQYQTFTGSTESPQTGQNVPPRDETVSPLSDQYQAFVGSTQSPIQTYAAFKPTNPQEHQVSPPKPTPPQPYRPVSTDNQRPSGPQISPPTQSPVQTTSQFSPPSVQTPASADVSPRSQFTSPAQRYGSPQPVAAIIPAQQTLRHNSMPLQAVELPSGPYDTAVSGTKATSFSSQAKQPTVPIEYADGLMLASEDTNYQPAPRDTFKRPSYVPQPITQKIQCTGFEPTLTDINQFFELRPDIVKQYHIPHIEGGAFAICEYCFHTFVEPHPWLASLFYPRPRSPRPSDKAAPQISFEKMIGCGLAFPRIRQVVLGQTIPSRNIQPFIDYAKLDATLPPCTGEPQSGEYFGSHAISSIALCASCFECYIKNTAFEQHFSRMIMPSPDQQWICDVGYSGYVHRTLLADIAQNPPNFGHFAAQANKRLAMPPCTGHKQPIACSGPQGSTIFRSVKDNCGVFCSGCFHDIVVGTPAEQDFGYEIEIDDDQKASLSCDLTFPFSNEGMVRAVVARDFDVWHAPIVAGNTTALCPSIAGHDEATLMEPGAAPWYCFKDFPSIEVCARCYGMQMVQAQAEELFLPITRPLVPGRIRQCYMSPAKDPSCMSWDPMDYENTTAWRGQYLRNVINWCRDAGGDFAIAKEAAARIATLPPPCGSELRKFSPPSGRKFFGHQAGNANDQNDATILMCEECFHYAAKGTPMESFFSNDLTDLAYRLSPDGHRCSTWSVQTKRRLREACLTNTFATYAQYHHKREAVFNALWQSIRELQPLNELLKQHTANINRQTELNLQMGSLRLMQQLNTQMNATIMGVGGSVAEAAASDTGYRYGNSTVGMNYLTPNGANAAMAQHSAANLPGLNLAMWEGASTERLTAEVQRRLNIQEELREQWKVMD